MDPVSLIAMVPVALCSWPTVTTVSVTASGRGAPGAALGLAALAFDSIDCASLLHPARTDNRNSASPKKTGASVPGKNWPSAWKPYGRERTALAVFAEEATWIRGDIIVQYLSAASRLTRVRRGIDVRTASVIAMVRCASFLVRLREMTQP